MAARAPAKSDVPPARPLANNPACIRCNLHERSNTVCCDGSGPLSARVWLWGEALGAREEELGKPFVGDAGRKLNYCLERAGLPRKTVRIENTVKCRPPGNRKPSRRQMDACWGYSLYSILKHKPQVIVAMGATAIEQLFFEPGAKKAGRVVDSWRGFYTRRTFRWESPKTHTLLEHTCWVVPTYHPSLCLRQWERDDLLVFDLMIAKELAEGREPMHYPTTKVTVLRTRTEAVAFLRFLRRCRGFVSDVEDTSLQVHDSEVMCIGFCYKAGHATILPLMLQGDPPKPAWTPAERREILDELAITLEQARLSGQNAKYDFQRYRKLTGLTDLHLEFDTMVAHHVIDENKPHNLTFLTQWFLGWKKYDAALDPYKDGKAVRMWLVPDQIRHTYCGYDCDGTFQLKAVLKPMLREQGVEDTYRIEHDLTLPLADMEYRGIHLDRERMVELGERYRKQAAKALARLRKIAVRLLGPRGAELNPGSGPQLASLLKAAGARMRKRTTSGLVSTDKSVLAALALTKGRAGSVARAVQSFRKVEKYISTYLDGDTISKRDKETRALSASVKRKARGRVVLEVEREEVPRQVEVGGWMRWLGTHDRVHTNYNIAIARTGRLSADDPPVQTAPRTGDIRSIVIPDNPDTDCLLSADYQKVELCVAAWLANDETMIGELIAGVDLHSKMAITSRMMRNPTEEEWQTFLALEKRLKAGEALLWEELDSKQLALLSRLGVKRKGAALVGPIITKDERAIAKGVNFGAIYGRGAGNIVSMNPDSFPLGMPNDQRRERVQRVLDAFMEKYHGIAAFREEQIDKLHRDGFLRTTITGRLRRFTGMDWLNSKWAQRTSQHEHDLAHMEREALNTEVQSEGSADPLARATRRIYDGAKRTRLPGFRILLSLHDGMLFNCNRSCAEEAEAKLHDWMEVTLPKDKRHHYEVPLKIDTTTEDYWGQSDA